MSPSNKSSHKHSKKTVTTRKSPGLLPITLLSGFLGSGKTTLLEHILRSKDHGLRCAVIVNDMGALNIDADLINSRQVVQKEERVVQMENGCICCTLREDLLEEVVGLAESGAFDYLVIESTGISEPMQVAETFTSEFLEEMASSGEMQDEIEKQSPVIAKLLKTGGISRIARLDTCVTVIDCLNFFSAFETVESLQDRYGEEVGEEDERTIADLMVDQIEFANVILLNKIDLVSKDVLAKVEATIKTLNPSAVIIRTKYSRVNLKDILNTKLFDFDKAATSAGWLQSLNEMTVQANGKRGPKPETLEYGISSFIYRARKPFHPERLTEAIKKKFLVMCLSGSDYSGEDQEEEDQDMWEADNDEDEQESEGQDETEEMDDADSPVFLKKSCPVFGPMLRSKGFFWLASCPKYYGEWSQAGCVLSVGISSKWFCEADPEEWPEDPVAIKSIKADFENGKGWKWGDRRQELVIIGAGLNENLITETLDECLLNEEEWSQWQELMEAGNFEEIQRVFHDPLALSNGIENDQQIEEIEEEEPMH